MLKRLGCSTRIAIGILLLLALLFIVGLIAGPIGRSLLGDIPALSFLKVKEPHFALAAEPVTHVGDFPVTNTLLASWISLALLIVAAALATRRMQLVPGRFQALMETIVESLYGFVTGVAGEKHGRQFFPVIATIFILVITNAYLALLPFYGSIGFYEHGEFVPLLRAANTDINLPLSIAVASVISIEYFGLRSLGLSGYLLNFFNIHPLVESFRLMAKGKIRPAMMGIMFGIINVGVGLLEVFSHTMRALSFTFRLFGNMTAGEILLLVATFLMPLMMALPFYGLELLIGFIQALIFAGLTLVFATVSVASHGEESH